MSRLSINTLLSTFQNELKNEYGINAKIRYFRNSGMDELTNDTQYYLELGAFQAERENIGSPRVRQEIRLISESTVNYDSINDEIENAVEFFERIVRDLIKSPGRIAGVFLEGASTFADAPTFYGVEASQNGYNAFAGVAFNFIIE